MSSRFNLASVKEPFKLRVALFCALACVFALAITAAMAAKKKPPAHPIDLNTATMEQLEELPGVGPVTAKAIIDFRAKSGPFKRTGDLLAVPRISKKRFQKLLPYITVTPRAPAGSRRRRK